MNKTLALIEGQGLLDTALSRWGESEKGATHVGDSESLVYKAQLGEDAVFLRFSLGELQPRSQIEAELDFIEHLKDSGVSVTYPIHSTAGNRIEEIDHDTVIFYVTAFKKMPGRHINYQVDNLDENLHRNWGRTLGSIHKYSKLFKPSGNMRENWDEDKIIQIANKGEPNSEPAAVDELKCVIDHLSQLPRNTECYGLIHCDFAFRNFLIEENLSTIHAIDFADSCYHWYIADVACSLWATRHFPKNKRHEVLTWFMDGYRQECSMDDTWLNEFSWFIRLRTVYLFIHFTNGEWDKIKHPNQSQWIEQTRKSLSEKFVW